MSQNQIRTRFIAFDLKLTTLPEREDIHIALGIVNVQITKLLDVIAHHCGLTVMSISFASVPFVVKNALDTAASLQGPVLRKEPCTRKGNKYGTVSPFGDFNRPRYRHSWVIGRFFDERE